MEDIKLKPIYKQTLNSVNFQELTLNGVLNISGFDEGLITLDTEAGRIFIEGEDLKIESLEKDGGNIFIKGDIKGIFRESNAKIKRGFFSKIFG